MLTLPSNQQTKHPLTALPPKKLVVLGDSLVYGFGDVEGGGWVERLRRSHMEPGSQGPVVYNLGIRGDGVFQVAKRLEQEFRLRGELRNRFPDLIVLSVGINDSARVGGPSGRHYTAFENFQQGIDDLLSQAKALCPVLFVGMTPVNEAQMPFAEILYYCHANQQRYVQATQAACDAHGIPYLDVFSCWLERGDRWWQSRLTQDGLHPNSAGYRALLADIQAWEPMQPYLG